MLDLGDRFLTTAEERLLLRIARDSLNESVANGRYLDLDPYPLGGRLLEHHGAFVTLRQWNGELRGCVGYVANCGPLAEAVRDNAFNAALRDSRFPPIRPAELPDIRVEVSALAPGDTPDSPFRRVYDLQEIHIGRDGLYIECPPTRGGILLPQVAVEEGWDVPTFLAAVCRKAGYPTESWREPDTVLYRFSAQVFAEEEMTVS